VIQLYSITNREKTEYLAVMNQIMEIEDQRDTKKEELAEYEAEIAKVIAGYKETIRDFEFEVKKKWNEIRTGQLDLDLLTIEQIENMETPKKEPKKQKATA